MNSRPPQGFIGVNVAHASKRALIKEQSFDLRSPAAQKLAEIRFTHLERIRTQSRQIGRLGMLLNEHPAEASNIAIAQLLTVIEAEENVRMRLRIGIAVRDSQVSGHAQVNNQVNFGPASAVGAFSRTQFENEELTVPTDTLDSFTRGAFGDRCGIVDKIRLAKAHVENFSTW